MFCPKCGCMLPDGSSVCKECGYRIGRGLRDSLCEEQPTDDPVRTSSSTRAVKHEVTVVAGIALSLTMVVSLFLEWLGPGISGLGLVMDGPDIGRASDVFCFVPLAIAVIGVFLTVHFAFGIGPRSAVFPLGIVCAALVVMFCAEVGWNYIYSTGLGAYTAMLSSAITAMLGLRRL